MADNGSTDDTVAVAESYADRFGHLEVVEASARRGRRLRPQHGMPSGARRVCSCSATAMTSPTATGSRRWPRPGSRARSWPDASTRCASPPTPPTATTCHRRRPRQQLRGFLPFADSASLGIGRHDLAWVGGFDESFRFSQDVELSWRAQVAGLTFVDAPDAVIFKRGAPKGWIRFRQYHRWGRAATRLYRRYHDQGMPKRPAAHRDPVVGGARDSTRRGAPFDLEERDLAIRQAGWYTGYLAGSIRYRVVYL